MVAIDGYFSEEECRAYAALVEEDGDGGENSGGRPSAVLVASCPRRGSAATRGCPPSSPRRGAY